MKKRHRRFAELLPHAYVLGSFRFERYRINVVQNVGLAHQVEQVGMVDSLKCLNEVVQDELLVDRDWREINDRHQRKLALRIVPFHGNLAIFLLTIKSVGKKHF